MRPGRSVPETSNSVGDRLPWPSPSRTPFSNAAKQESTPSNRSTARASGKPALISVTSLVGSDVDPTAAVVASRRAGEPWFCLEQPDRSGSALAAIGSVHVVEARGAGRF